MDRTQAHTRRSDRPRTRVRAALLLTLAIIIVGAASCALWRLRAPQAAMEAPLRQLSWSAWDEGEAPEYWRVLGPAVVDVDVPAGEIWYAPLDSLGRARRAVGTITQQMMADGIARERADLRELSPAGWGHNQEVEIELSGGRLYHGYLFNRSHLMAKSLGGSDSIENLVTGTRTLNVGANDGNGGMAYAETLARDWLWQNPEGTLFYSAQPVYEAAELVCRSVIVDIRSSDGSIDLEIEVYNAARGYELDYARGLFYPTST